MRYKKQLLGGVLKIDGEQQNGIPESMDNADWRLYLEWLAAGNTPEPADPEPSKIPSIVTMRQARLALLGAGMLDQVESAIDSMPGTTGAAARIEWEYSTTLERGWRLVAALAQQLKLDDAALDALFDQASKL